MVKCSKSDVRRLKTALLRWKKVPEKQRERMKMVLLREYGLTQPAIAEAMGSSLSTVNRAHMAYDEGGLDKRSDAESTCCHENQPLSLMALLATPIVIFAAT